MTTKISGVDELFDGAGAPLSLGGGGFVNLSAPHKGALISRTSNLASAVTTDAQVAWQTANYDTLHDPNDSGLSQRFWLGVNQTFVDGDVDDVANDIIISGHGFDTGEGPVRLSNSGGTLPAGLSTGTDYWTIEVDINTLAFATSRANAIAGAKVDITAAVGGGTHTIETETKLIVPAGITKVRLTGEFFSDDFGANQTSIVVAHIRKNFTGANNTIPIEGLPNARHDDATFNDQHNLTSSVIEVSEGDVFEMGYWTAGSIDIGGVANKKSWFAIEVVETSNVIVQTELLSGTFHVREEQTSGTEGGTFTQDSYTARVLNTVATNTITGASLSSNQVTLPAGTYEIEAVAPARAVNRNKLRLRDTTASADLVIGVGATFISSNDVQGNAVLNGRFTLSQTSVLELQHQCSSTKTTNGLGTATTFGDVEVYADVIIRQLST